MSRAHDPGPPGLTGPAARDPPLSLPLHPAHRRAVEHVVDSVRPRRGESRYGQCDSPRMHGGAQPGKALDIGKRQHSLPVDLDEEHRPMATQLHPRRL